MSHAAVVLTVGPRSAIRGRWAAAKCMALRNFKRRTLALASVRRDIPHHYCKLERGLDLDLGEYLSRHSRELGLAGRGGTYSGHERAWIATHM